MSSIKRFEDILAWNSLEGYMEHAARTHFVEIFGLKDQICRAAVSAMSNVAEGFGRKTNKDFAHFLDQARASAVEVQSLLYIAS